MKTLSQWLTLYGTLHHAHLFLGDKEQIIPRLEQFFEAELGFVIKGNPDYWREHFSLFGVAEGHQINGAHFQKGFLSQRKIFVLSFDSISIEAQNSLLKMFEEPVPSTHFFIIVPSVEMITPTLRSRFLIIDETGVHNKDYSLAKKFASGQIKDRLDLVSSFVEDKDKKMAETFLFGLEVVYSSEECLKKKDMQDFLNEVFVCEKYLRDRSVSLKLIFEHLAVVAPVVI